jgi:hypothetical protein
MKIRPMSHRMSLIARPTLLGALAAMMLGGCVVGPPPRPRPPPPPPPAPDTTVYAYPQQGQTPEQQDRDRYECYLWASQQTGFDPSAPNVPPHDRFVVMGGPPGPPPGAQTAVGAVTGGIIGALIAPPRAAGFGAVAGALVGGTIGASAEASQNQQAQYVASQNAAAQQAQMGQIEQKASDYRRALGACLEGRGYTVK